MVLKITYLFLLVFLLSRPVWSEPIAIIVNNSNPIEDIEPETLSKIYKGEKSRWDNGEPIICVNWPAKTQIRALFYEIVLKSEQTKTFFKLDTPIPMSYVLHKNSRSIKRFISHVEQSIGYIYLSDVDDSVKVLSINGLTPTSENINSGKYVLQQTPD